MNIYEKLSNIQNELKAPKNQRNSFGNYNYRSCEDILEAVKPICQKNNTTLILSDEVIEVGTRIYVKANAILIDCENDNLSVSNSALARECENKKGMDDSQITGTASSYARKYALNGLFNIDDTKDADTDEYKKTTQKAESKSIDKSVNEEFQVTTDDKVTDLEAKTVYSLITKQGRDLNKFFEYFKVKNTNELTKAQYVEALQMLKGDN